MTRTGQRVTCGQCRSRSTSRVGSARAGDCGTSRISVQKYGGSSLATIGQIRRVARLVADTHRSGRLTVVVVSARGRTTDELLGLADVVGRQRTGRETDQLLATGESASAALLAIALQDLNVPAISLTGAQAGIQAAGKHGSGLIAKIDARRLQRILTEGQVAVVAGFQGIDDMGDVLTLGRGGSDTTAVALAAVLRAGTCEICTDVPGVSTADPRVVDNVQTLPIVDVGVMAEMSFSGAKVLHSRAVDLAARNCIELRVRSSDEAGVGESGTVIPASRNEAILETQPVVVAIAHDLDVNHVFVRCDSHHTDLTADILAVLSAYTVPVDFVARSGPQRSSSQIDLIVPRKDCEELLSKLREVMNGHRAEVHVDENVGKLSLIGMSLLNHPEYTARMLSTLTNAGIRATWLSTSQIRTSVVIPRDRVLGAVRLLHDEFGLNRDDLDPVATRSARR